MKNTHSPSGERSPVTHWVSPATASQPLAGRSSYEDRLRIWREGKGPKPDVAPFLGFEGPFLYPKKIERFERPVVSSSLQACVACALSGALSASIIAILIFWLTRPAAAMIPALLPREPMVRDAEFGLVALGAVLLVAFALAIYGALRRDAGAFVEVRGKKIPIGDFDPDKRHLEPRYQPPARGPRFGEDDRYG